MTLMTLFIPIYNILLLSIGTCNRKILYLLDDNTYQGPETNPAGYLLASLKNLTMVFRPKNSLKKVVKVHGSLYTIISITYYKLY